MAQIARGVGAHGTTVERPEQLGPALQEAFAAGRPALIDVRVDPDAEPPMADRIQGLLQSSGRELSEAP
jgi:thiamine pyrophosphate-dependent acetolactate synthase large subunit-like protein